MEQAIIELTRAVNRLADATEGICATMENLTEKGGKENLPIIPPLKESPKKKSPQSACARVREEEPELAARFDEFWAARTNWGQSPLFLWDTAYFFRKLI